MANTIIITKLENGNVDIVDSTAIDKSRTREGGFATRILDAERVIVEDSGSGKGVETFSYIDVEKVIRADGTEVAISDLSTLYSELKEFFFFELSGTGGGGGVVVDSSKVAVIASGAWIAGGTSGSGSTHHFIFTHGLKTQDLIFEARDTDGDFVRQLNDYYTIGFGITDSINQVRIETSDDSLNVAVLISNGGNSTLLPESTVDAINAITFLNTNGAYFGSFASARTGTLTFDTTGAVTGAISVVYYDNATLDIPVTPIFTNGTFAASVVNKLYFERDADNNYTLNIIN